MLGLKLNHISKRGHWWQSDLGTQRICSHGVDLVVPEYSGLTDRMVHRHLFYMEVMQVHTKYVTLIALRYTVCLAKFWVINHRTRNSANMHIIYYLNPGTQWSRVQMGWNTGIRTSSGSSKPYMICIIAQVLEIYFDTPSLVFCVTGRWWVAGGNGDMWTGALYLTHNYYSYQYFGL